MAMGLSTTYGCSHYHGQWKVEQGFFIELPLQSEGGLSLYVLTAYNNSPSRQDANYIIPHANRKNRKGILNNVFTSTTRRRTQIVLAAMHLSVREPIFYITSYSACE